MKIFTTLVLSMLLSTNLFAEDWVKANDYCIYWNRLAIDASEQWRCDYNQDGRFDDFTQRFQDGELIVAKDTNYDGAIDVRTTTYTVNNTVAMAIVEQTTPRYTFVIQNGAYTHHIWDENGDGYLDSLWVPGRNLSFDRASYPTQEYFRPSAGIKCDPWIQNNYYQQALAIRNRYPVAGFAYRMTNQIQLVEQQIRDVCKSLNR